VDNLGYRARAALLGEAAVPMGYSLGLAVGERNGSASGVCMRVKPKFLGRLKRRFDMGKN